VPRFEIGSVTIISGGVEYKPYAQTVAIIAPATSSGGLVSATPVFRPLEELPMPEIQYADDFQIIVHGEDARRIAYTLYDENFELVVYGGSMLVNMRELTFPDEAGIYILGISVTWSYQAGGARAERTSRYTARIIR